MGLTKISRFALFLLSFIFITTIAIKSHSEENDRQQLLTKYQIYKARYATIEEVKRKAKFLETQYKDDVVGQDSVIESLQSRILNYLEVWGRNLGKPASGKPASGKPASGKPVSGEPASGEPVAAHLLGLPGIGKSLILDNLGENLGLTTFRIDAQNYVNPTVEDITRLGYILSSIGEQSKKEPVILIIEELDKIPEIQLAQQSGLGAGLGGVEKTSPLIGLVNQILTNGVVRDPTFGKAELSNVLVVTSMNLPQEEIERFTKDFVGNGTQKDFFDLTIEDLIEFDRYLREQPQALGKILSKLFRFNTVSRIVANAILVPPLTQEQHRQISELIIDKEVRKLNERKDVQVSLTLSKKLKEYIADNSINAPTGARSTVMITRRLIEQVILASIHLGKTKDSFLRPRKVYASLDESGTKLVIEIVPQKRVKKDGKIVLADDKSEKFSVEFDNVSKNFRIVPLLQKSDEKLSGLDIKEVSEKEEKPNYSQTAIGQRRYGEGKKRIFIGLADELNKRIFGQEDITQTIESDLDDLWAVKAEDRSEPVSRVLAGFPGIGKSDLIQQTSEITGIPVVKFNMQSYASVDTNSTQSFGNDLKFAVTRAEAESEATGKGKRIILLIEEIDKIYEVDPQTGKVVNRPIMGIVKELINSGRYTGQYGSVTDVRSAYIVCTMNFGADMFGFEADPSLTAIEDVIAVWKRLKKSTVTLQGALKSLFLPETVNRLLSKIAILKPLEREEYFKLIEKIRKNFEERRFNKQKLEVRVELTNLYREYLFKDTTIPSEGARNTVKMAGERIQLDVESGYSKIRKSSELGKLPIVITLDYDEGTNTVRVYAMPDSDHPALKGKMSKDEALSKRVELDNKRPLLNFPPVRINGPIPQNRMLVSVHEFGHAFSAVMFGIRFRDVTVVTNKPGAGGYVSFPDVAEIKSARELYGRVYVTLASRAMERIYYSDNPLDPKSIYGVSAGASNDITQATNLLITLVHRLGLSPYDGTGDWSANLDLNGQKAPNLPEAERVRITNILRQMEDHIVKEFLVAHKREWYLGRITELAREGRFSERQFYELLGYKYAPGVNQLHDPERNSRVGKEVSVFDEETKAVMEARNGDTGRTAKENMDNATLLVDRLLQNKTNSPDSQQIDESKSERKLSFAEVVGAEFTVDEFLQAFGFQDGYINEYAGGKRVVAKIDSRDIANYTKSVAIRSVAIVVTGGENPKILLRVGANIYLNGSNFTNIESFYGGGNSIAEVVIFADERTISETQSLIESRGANIDLTLFGLKANGSPMDVVKANWKNPMADVITVFNGEIDSFIDKDVRAGSESIVSVRDKKEETKKYLEGRRFAMSKERLLFVRRVMVDKMLRKAK